MSINWNRKTWLLAGPIMISNVSVPMLGAVDAAVVGRLPGAHYLGAVAVGALIFSVVYASLNFLRMGTTGLTAQSLGADQPDEVRSWLARAALLSLILGSLLILTQSLIGWAAIEIVSPSDMVTPLVKEYFFIRIWSAPATLMNFALLGWFFGIQNTRAALISQIFMNGVNIILDIWFVIGFGWGVEGVAWATLISEVSAVGLGLYLARHELKRIGGHWQRKRIFDQSKIIKMLRVNFDIFIRSMFLQASFVVFTSISARMSDTILAANSILLIFQSIMAYALDGFANAVEVLAGEAFGARNRLIFRQAVVATSRWALIFSVIFVGAYLVGGDYLINILTTVPEVREQAHIYLVWAAISPIVSVWSFQLDGIYIGTTRTADMRNMMLVSFVTLLACTALFVPAYGNHGLWLAFTVFMAVRGITLGILYPRLERSIESSPAEADAALH